MPRTTSLVRAPARAPLAAPPAASSSSRELDLLLAVQRVLAPRAAVTGARVLGAAGEHAALWLALGAGATALDAARRPAWARATAAVAVSHALSVALKRVVRRARPAHPELLVRGHGLGRFGFPSSHAASTTTAALALRSVTGWRWPLLVPPAMGLSRMVAGAHYASDVLAGAALGSAVAATALPGPRAPRGGRS